MDIKKPCEAKLLARLFFITDKNFYQRELFKVVVLSLYDALRPPT